MESAERCSFSLSCADGGSQYTLKSRAVAWPLPGLLWTFEMVKRSPNCAISALMTVAISLIFSCVWRSLPSGAPPPLISIPTHSAPSKARSRRRSRTTGGGASHWASSRSVSCPALPAAAAAVPLAPTHRPPRRHRPHRRVPGRPPPGSAGPRARSASACHSRECQRQTRRVSGTER